MSTPTTNDEFNALLSESTTEFDVTDYETSPGNPLANQHKELGYQIYENLRGYI